MLKRYKLTKSFIDSIPLEESESKIFTEILQQLVLDFLSLNQKLILLKHGCLMAKIKEKQLVNMVYLQFVNFVSKRVFINFDFSILFRFYSFRIEKSSFIF